MNDIPEVSSEASPPVLTANKKRKPFLFWFFLLLLLVVSSASFYFFKRYENREQAELTLLKTRLNEAGILTENLQKINDQQQEAMKQLQNEVAVLNNHWQMISEDAIKEWQIKEARYLIHQASMQLTIMKNGTIASLLLERANAILQKIADIRLDPIRGALQQDMTNLKPFSEDALTSVYQRLVALRTSLATLPIPELTSSNEEKNPLTGLDGKNLSWWQKGWHYSLMILQKVVTVRYTPTEIPLILPEEKIRLYHALQTEVDNAIWALLQHQAVIYKESLNLIEEWVKHFFVQEADSTKKALASLEVLQQEALPLFTLPTLSVVPLMDSFSLSSSTKKIEA